MEALKSIFATFVPVTPRLTIALILILSGLSGVYAENPFPKPENGILDLREIRLGPELIVNLNGEWIFTWEEFTKPGTVLSQGPNSLVVEVPSYWNSYELGGEKLPGQGYGSYELLILLPENFRSQVRVDVPLFDVAYRMLLDGEEVAANGRVGQKREEEEAWYEPLNISYSPTRDSLHVVVHVSNFHHRRGGYWQDMVVGNEDLVSDFIRKREMYNYATIGTLFFFMIFFLFFWSFVPKERSMLFFALTTLGILMRSVNTGEYFSNAFVEAPWSWQIRMEYLGSYLAELFGMFFLHSIFRRKYMEPFLKLNTLVMGLAMLSLFLPVHLFTYGMLLFQPLLVLVLSTYIVISIRDAFQGKLINIAFLASLSFFLFTTVNDIMLANSGGAVTNKYMTQISFQLFILSMALSVVLQWLQNQKVREKLESSLHFKNRVLSVIAHDLKAPVASISQFTELLVSKPELGSRENVLASLQESSQAALNLLNTLLYWGRSEDKRLQINPVSLDVDSQVKEICKLYRHTAEQKGLRYHCESASGIRVFSDPEVFNIILRNLLANAIKFTPRGGEIHLEFVEKGSHVISTVRDSGVGIREEVLREFRSTGIIASSKGTDQEIGTGLGLQLVNDLLGECGGKLDIDSTEGRGSSISFTLPSGQKTGS